MRQLDEREDWRRIGPETLNKSYTAPTFMDPVGFVYHLPAFLIAELNDMHDDGFIERLYNIAGYPRDWFRLLTQTQRDAIADVLQLTIEHPNYMVDATNITMAIDRYRSAWSAGKQFDVREAAEYARCDVEITPAAR